MMEKRQLINADEVSQMLRVRRGTVYKFVAQRRIPFVKIGRATRFELGAIHELIKKNSVAVKDFS